MDKVDIRPIKESDILTIADFEKEICIISFGDTAVTDLDVHQKKLLKSYKKNPEGMFVLTVDEKISGWLWMDEKINFLTNEKYINFRSFYIVKEFQGTELTGELMKFAMDFCKSVQANMVVGKVFIDNISMRALYKEFGFKPTHLSMEYKF
ncbi:GCN5-related N-acetyltransferase [Ruminiclostridium papyrosolvens DSM 2782]|uniref:GCN5-related N-acetyltransferase n=1 Tax=Ruminiclostridium papyrosolvens DSM 2782 TaxID=588581 RepID=F1T7B5_9FIRM|nr:GNAT family N-acetyltransferase [Ruminiclostridium papyrosolvens]EGD49363.1 GCN5-related N-acetyltransferase [Ruminiclostridium papyrosolvens DSM 2782]WES33510.1 GNAT family N-acetyltransferase [Ruminiclostridium papyrosolvens DSM 2782]